MAPRDDISDTGGQALAEFALVFPLLLLSVLIVMQLSLLAVARASTAYAAYAAARAALVEDLATRDRPIDPAAAARVALLPVTGTTTLAVALARSHMPPRLLGGLSGWGAQAANLPLRWRAAQHKTRATVRWEESWARAEVEHDFELSIPGAGRAVAWLWWFASDAGVSEGARLAAYGAPHVVIRDECSLPAPWREIGGPSPHSTE
ncbi:MAG: pilus assembly protein [Planctomycetes bacterium]|nr:pilus assembly protein [Planctomycetota bacterium]